MSVVIQDEFTGGAEPIDQPRICYQKHEGTATGFQTQAGTSPSFVTDGETWSVWTGTAANASLTITYPGLQNINYAGLAAHNLGSSGSNVTVLVSTDGSTFSQISGLGAHAPTDDSAILFLFSAQVVRAIRFQFGGGTPPLNVAVAQAGEALEMPRLSVFTGLPISESKQVRYRHQQSITGDVLGRAVEGAELAFDLEVNNLPESFRESADAISWKGLLAHIDAVGPFFIAAKPLKYPDDVAYVRVTERPRFERQTPNRKLSGSVTFSCRGYAAP